MKETPSAPSQSLLESAAKRTRTLDWERLGFLYARIALGAAFLSGIADRFGLYWGRNVGYGNFDGFMQYTAKVNSFMPPVTIPFLAWAATAGELFFGIALGNSFGIKSPMDYSVFSASGAAILLALRASGQNRRQSVQ